jgi:membrane associated rhomboid family serine protease
MRSGRKDRWNRISFFYVYARNATHKTVRRIPLCILFRLFVMGKKKFLSQPLAYLFLGGLLGELFVLLPAVAGVWSMIIHMSGIAIGIIMSIVFRKDINNHL